MGVARSKSINLIYNWSSAFQDMKYSINEVRYTDDMDKLDDIEFSLIDEKQKKWFNLKKINLGNSIDIEILLTNWRYTNDTQKIKLGKFYIDSFELKHPLVTFKGVSFPVESNFKHKKRNETLKKTTLKSIASKIAKRYSVKLVYDAADITLFNIERKNQTDSEFLLSLCKEYGLKIKLYSKKLIIFDLQKYYAKKALCTLKPIDISPGWRYKEGTQGTYTACEFEFTTKKNKHQKVRIGKGKRCLYISGSAYNTEDAKKKALSQVLDANLKAYNLSFSTLANKKIFAGATVKIKGFGLPDGKWLIKRVTHTLSANAYTYNVECVKVVGV